MKAHFYCILLAIFIAALLPITTESASLTTQEAQRLAQAQAQRKAQEEQARAAAQAQREAQVRYGASGSAAAVRAAREGRAQQPAKAAAIAQDTQKMAEVKASSAKGKEEKSNVFQIMDYILRPEELVYVPVPESLRQRTGFATADNIIGRVAYPAKPGPTGSDYATARARADGWNFNAENTFEHNDIVLVPRSNKTYMYGLICIRMQPGLWIDNKGEEFNINEDLWLVQFAKGNNPEELLYKAVPALALGKLMPQQLGKVEEEQPEQKGRQVAQQPVAQEQKISKQQQEKKDVQKQEVSQKHMQEIAELKEALRDELSKEQWAELEEQPLEEQHRWLKEYINLIIETEYPTGHAQAFNHEGKLASLKRIKKEIRPDTISFIQQAGLNPDLFNRDQMNVLARNYGMLFSVASFIPSHNLRLNQALPSLKDFSVNLVLKQTIEEILKNNDQANLKQNIVPLQGKQPHAPQEIEKAIETGDKKTIEDWLLKEGGSPNARIMSMNQEPLLYLAALYGCFDCVKALFKKPGTHVRVNARQILAATPGRVSIAQSRYWSGEERGDTALAAAAHEGFIDIVNFLIEQGADVNSKDHYNNTPLTHAARAFVLNQYYPFNKDKPHHNLEVIKTLLLNGADPTIRNHEGSSFTDYATRNPALQRLWKEVQEHLAKQALEQVAATTELPHDIKEGDVVSLIGEYLMAPETLKVYKQEHTQETIAARKLFDGTRTLINILPTMLTRVRQGQVLQETFESEKRRIFRNIAQIKLKNISSAQILEQEYKAILTKMGLNFEKEQATAL
jgi:hypothetical protein